MSTKRYIIFILFLTEEGRRKPPSWGEEITQRDIFTMRQDGFRATPTDFCIYFIFLNTGVDNNVQQ